MAYYVCLLDSQAMAFTSPGLPGVPFNPSPPLITDQQAGAMQMQAPTQEQVAAWHNYQAQLAQAYAMQAQAQAIGTAPLLAPPMMAAHMAPPFMPPLPLPCQSCQRCHRWHRCTLHQRRQGIPRHRQWQEWNRRFQQNLYLRQVLQKGLQTIA